MTSDEMESTHWKNSRHGAWASGGFHYQHLIAVYLLLRQWNKQDSTGAIIPEGFDDISIEYPDNDLWIQVKSRNSGHFSENEIKAFHLKSLEKAKTVTGSTSEILVVSERPIKGKEADRLETNSLDSNKHLYCDDPLSSILKIIQGKTDVLEGTAFNIATCLHFWVSSVARKNGHSEYKKRTKITQSDLEAKIQDTIESGDIDHLDKIIENRILVPVDFITPIEDHRFYTGVKVQPGHIAAGLVFDRPDDVTKCRQLIDKTQQLLITAPSGSGKSALMWLVAKVLSEKITWYRTSSMTGVLNLEQAMCFVRVFKPSLLNPLGIIVDDVAQENSAIWNSLSDELSLIPGCYLLGSARAENRALIKSNNLLQNYVPELSEALAQELWNELQDRNLTLISHWKESFEQSRGLILEYMHILTQGETLRSTIRSQIHVREQEGRLDEIKILRTASLAISLGGEVSAPRLIESLDIDNEKATLALKRLLDEHLISELEPGVIGGIHDLRSMALCEETHDDVVNLLAASFHLVLASLTINTIPSVIRCAIARKIIPIDSIYSSLHSHLLQFNNASNWIAIFEGLKATSIDEYVTALGECLLKYDFPRSLWHFAAMFSDPKLEIPNIEGATFFEDLQNVYTCFRKSGVQDHRQGFLNSLKRNVLEPPNVSQISELVGLFSAWAPIICGDPILPTSLEIKELESDVPIEEVISLLQTAYFYNKNTALDIVEGLGGAEKLLQQYKAQTAFIQAPKIIEDDKGSIEVSSNFYVISDQYQDDAHETVVEICEKLLALAPQADSVKCAAVSGDGTIIRVSSNFTLAEKNIPRENLPEKIRINLNQEFIRSFKEKYSSFKTEYISALAPLLVQTEKAFRKFSENWIKGKSVSDADALAETINEITDMAQSILLVQETDDIGAADITSLIVNVLKNIVRRMCNIRSEITCRALPAYLTQQAKHADELLSSPIWSYIENPPLKQFKALQARLIHISDIIHEMVGDELSADIKIQSMVKHTKGAGRDRAIGKVALKAKFSAQKKLQSQLRDLTKAYKEQSYTIECILKDIDDLDSPFWPRVDLCVLVHVDGIIPFLEQHQQNISLIRSYIDIQNSIVIAPSIKKKIIPVFAFNVWSDKETLDVNFAEEWQSKFGYRFAKMPFTDHYDKALAAIYGLSGFLASISSGELHPDEVKLFESLISDFENPLEALEKIYEASPTDAVGYAIDNIAAKHAIFMQERKSKESGEEYVPMCREVYQALQGEGFDEKVLEIKIMMIEEECNAKR